MKERRVPAQQLSDAGEDLVRLAAAKDAEIAALKADFQNASDAADAYCAESAALTKERDVWKDQAMRSARATGELAQALDQRDTLTEQRDALKADFQNASDQADEWCGKFCSLKSTVNGITEQRDRAMAERNETRDRTYETIRQVREQRDRAMKALRAVERDATRVINNARTTGYRDASKLRIDATPMWEDFEQSVLTVRAALDAGPEGQ